MLPGREDYHAPVGFAREPAVERWRWVKRLFLAAFLVGLGWLFLNGVISPPDDTGGQVNTQPSELPGPV